MPSNKVHSVKQQINIGYPCLLLWHWHDCPLALHLDTHMRLNGAFPHRVENDSCGFPIMSTENVDKRRARRL